MTYQKVIDWLFKQVPNYQHQGGTAYKPGLDRIIDLLHQLGNPHKKIKTIHIAGTNGKGSVSHILAAIFQEHGYKTGLFTSPHISDFRERIKINGDLIDKEFVIQFIADNKGCFETINPSFFEITTAMAFKAFAHHKCDIAIIETGLGGRLDSTNIIKPELSIITNIGIDHTAFLGNSLTEIALEKAGIIKPNTSVVIGDVIPELEDLFKKVALNNKSEITLSSNLESSTIQTDLLGSYQQRNIHTAMTAVKVLRKTWKLDDLTVKKALKHITTLSNLKGRLQQIASNPSIILDAAHNKEGIINLLKELDHFTYKRLRIIYGASNDKDWKSILKIFPQNATYYFTQFDSARSVTTKEFELELKDSVINFSIYKEIESALSQCKSDSNSSDLILVCGSFYLMEKIN